MKIQRGNVLENLKFFGNVRSFYTHEKVNLKNF